MVIWLWNRWFERDIRINRSIRDIKCINKIQNSQRIEIRDKGSYVEFTYRYLIPMSI